MAIRITPDLEQELRTLSELAPEGRTVELKLSRPPQSPELSEDEVLVVVLSAKGGVATRRALAAPVSATRLKLHLEGVEAAMSALEQELLNPGAAALSGAEAALLDGADMREDDAGSLGALERSKLEFELLVRRALPLDKAAARLGVSASRLRQRLSGKVRTLYGFKENGTWRVPTFQLSPGGKVIRGLEQVIPHLRSDANPLAVVRWFALPHSDLVVGEAQEPVSPIDWLSAGMNPEVVAQLAEEL